MGLIKVLIVDDHAIVREGLRALLENQSDIEVSGEATSGEEAVLKTKELRPDVVLMDVTMPGMNGLEATRQIKAQNPEVKIMALTMHESDDYFFNILEAGASGYFVKGGSSTELLSALHSIMLGDVFIYPSMAKKLLGHYLQRTKTGANQERHEILTNREREVLKLIAEGFTNQEIADKLFLSVATVQTHRAHIMTKLELRSPTELIKYAIRHGFIILDSNQ